MLCSDGRFEDFYVRKESVRGDSVFLRNHCICERCLPQFYQPFILVIFIFKFLVCVMNFMFCVIDDSEG